METIYAYAMICIFTCSLGNKPQGSRYLYLACIILFALVMLYAFIIQYQIKHIHNIFFFDIIFIIYLLIIYIKCISFIINSFMLTLSGITIYQVLKVKPKDETL